MAICAQMQDPYLTLLTGALFSRTAQALGRVTEAHALLRENLHIARETGNRWGIGLGLEQLAANAQTRGDPVEARQLLGESAAIYREIGDPRSLSRVLNALSQLVLAQSELVEAESSAINAFKTAQEWEYNLYALGALAVLAEIYARLGRRLAAFELALFVLQHPASAQEAKDRAEQLRAAAEAQLTAEEIALAHARAQSRTLNSLARELSS